MKLKWSHSGGLWVDANATDIGSNDEVSVYVMD